MDKDPETLEEALKQIESWRSAYTAKLVEIKEMNAEINRLSAEPTQESELESMAKASTQALTLGTFIPVSMAEALLANCGYKVRININIKTEPAQDDGKPNGAAP